MPEQHEASAEDTTNLLEAVRSWDIAAERDDIARYFYCFDDVPVIEHGEISIVIGHKGEGKSAIAGWIADVNNPLRQGRCANLSLRDFDFATLYELFDSHKAFQNQYSTLWSYIIICAICRSILADPAIDGQELQYLQRRFKREFSSRSLDLGDILRRGGGLSILGFSFSLGSRAYRKRRSVNRFRKVVERFPAKVANLSIRKPYYVIFDELDEDYHDILSNSDVFEAYRNLIIGLVRSVERMSLEFGKVAQPLHPIMMLRKDVYEAIHFNDKGKYRDRVLDISWTRGRLHKLLSFRIARSRDASIEANKIPPFNEMWNRVFDLEDFAKNRCSVTRLFDYIFNRTFLRPRDFVAFLRFCAKAALERDAGTGISVRDVVEAEAHYSKYLRQEVEDAIGGIHPDMLEAVRAISDIRKKVFSYRELQQAVHARFTDSLREALSEKAVIDSLYYFNVVGRHYDRYHGSFGFHRSGEKVNEDWMFVVHRGLWREFGLVRSDVKELKSAIAAQ